MRDINDEIRIILEQRRYQNELNRRTNQRLITPQDAIDIGRAYASNPNLNPEIIAAATLAGADQESIQQLSAFATNQQTKAGDFTSDNFGKEYHFPNGPVGSTATAQIDFLKENQIANVAETVDLNDEGGPNGVLGFLHRGFKGAVRGSLMVAESGWQGVSAMIRGITDYNGTSDVTIGNTMIPNPVAAFKNTQLFEAGRQLFQEGQVDTGSGYFAQGTVRENQEQRQKELLGTVDRPDGRTQAWTVGGGTLRFMMDQNILPENESLFNVGSGIIDAMGSIVFDPLNIAFGAGAFGKSGKAIAGAQKISSRTGKKVNQLIADARIAEESGDIAMAAKLNREALERLGVDEASSLNPRDLITRAQGLEEAQINMIAKMRDDFGFVSEGGKKMLVTPEFVRHFTDARGVKLASMMAEIDDTKTIWMLHKGKIGTKVTEDLAAAKTVDEVMEVYARALATPSAEHKNMLGLLPNTGVLNVANAGYTVRNVIAPYSKWFNYMPAGSVLDTTNGYQFINAAIELFNTIPTLAISRKFAGFAIPKGKRYDVEQRDFIVRKAIKAFADGDEGAIKNLSTEIAGVFERGLVELGYSFSEATEITKWSQTTGRMGKFSAADLNAGLPVDSSIIMANQILQNGAAVIDPSKLKEIVRGSGRVQQTFRINDKFHRNQAKMVEVSNEITDLRSLVGLDTVTDAQKTKFIKELGAKNKEYNELVARNAELVKKGDPKLLRAIEASKLRGDHFMTQWWKPLTLVRAAYVMRIVPEEIARVLMGGVFAQGPGAMKDYFLAVLGDVNIAGKAGLKGGGNYRADALARKWQGYGTKVDELNIQVTDLIDERDVLKIVAKNDESVLPQIQKLDDEIAALYDQIDDVAEQAHSMRMFNESQLSHTPGEALATVTRDTQGPSIADRKMLLGQTGHYAEAYRTGTGRAREDWVSGMVDYVNQAANDVHTKGIAQVLGRGKLSARNKFQMQGVVGTWDEHFQAGRIVDERQGLAAWMQTGSVKETTARLMRALNADGANMSIDNIDDVLKLLDRQLDHLSTIVGGRLGDVPFSPSALGLDAVDASFGSWRMIDGGNMDLIETIATGKFKGKPIQFYNRSRKGATVNDDLKETIRLFADDAAAPERVLYNTDKIHGEKVQKLFTDIVGSFFTQAYGIPSDKLARSPSFRRYYWEQMADLARSASDEAAEKLLANAQTAGLPKRLLTQIEDTLKARVPVDGGIDLQVMDDIAKSTSLGRVRDLLYDASRRGAGLDQFRLITPFGDAWREVFQFWAQTVVRQRGMPVKRLAKSIQGLRESGIMHQNPVTEEFEFTVPMSNKLNSVVEKIPGFSNLPEDFQMGNFAMPAKSMNVLGTFSPGIGPVADYTINTLIPDDPAWDQVRDWFFPIAEPAMPDTAAGRANLYQKLAFPSPWMRRVVAAGPTDGPFAALRNFVNDIENDPQYLATKNHVVKSLASSRGFSEASGAENRQKLFEDAEQIARRMFFLRGVVAFVGPGAPLATYVAETKQGSMNAALITDEWRKLEQQLLEAGENPGKASEIILETYGPDIWMYSSSNSSSTLKGAQSSKEWWDWYRTNRDVVDAFPKIGSYFGDTGDFDIGAYGSLFSRGIYKPNSSEEIYRQGATDIAYLAYNRLRDSFPPESQRTQEQRQIIAGARYGLEQYWGVNLSAAERIKERSEQLSELERLVRSSGEGNEVAERLMDTNTGQFLRTYMQQRELARTIAVVDHNGTTPNSWATMKATAYLRDVLRTIGTEMSAKDATFARIYQFVLDGEMGDDDDNAEDAGTFVEPVQRFPSSLRPSNRLSGGPRLSTGPRLRS